MNVPPRVEKSKISPEARSQFAERLARVPERGPNAGNSSTEFLRSPERAARIAWQIYAGYTRNDRFRHASTLLELEGFEQAVVYLPGLEA